MVICKCIFLDGREVEITIEPDAKGSDLFESICRYLNLTFRDPFGLAFRGGVGPAPYNWWVRMDKSLKRQIPGKCKVWEFAFIVKYYPTSLTGLQEEVARFHVCMQIRQDLLTGRLVCPAQTMALLCSYWLQSEYGDWGSRHIDLQLADAFRYVQKGGQESDNIENKSDIIFSEQMMQLHQTHRGMRAKEAEFRFIKLASSLSKYGVHYYPAYEPLQQKQQQGKKLLPNPVGNNQTEQRGERLILGIGPKGVHQCKKKTNEIVFTWKAMRAVSFKRNKVILKLQGSLRRSGSADKVDSAKEANPNQKQIVKSFLLEDMYQTKIVWQYVIENHMFFRVADKQGLKGEQRKRMINSLRFKRTIPLLGEKKAERSPFSPSSKASPRSLSEFEYDLTTPATPTTAAKKGNSARVARSSSQPPRPKSPMPVSQKMRMSLSSQTDRERYNGSSQTDNDDETDGAPRLSARKGTYPRPMAQEGIIEPDSTMMPTSSRSMPSKFQFPTKATHLRGSRNTSQTSTSGDEVLENISDATENTEVLCSPGILEKTFNYSEVGGVNNIGYWQGMMTPRGRSRAKKEGNPTRSPQTRSPSNQPGRFSSHYGTDNRESEDAKIRRMENSSPIVIPAEILMETTNYVRYDEEEGSSSGNRRRGSLLSSSDAFPMELDQPLSHRRIYTGDADEQELADITADSIPQQKKQYRSLSAISPRGPGRVSSQNRQMASERHTSPIRRRATPEENRSGARRRSPEVGPYSIRASSESHIVHKEQTEQSISGGAKKTPELPRRTGVKRRSPQAAPRRRNIASWSLGDSDRDLMPTSHTRRVGKEKSRKRNTIPHIPRFVRSVV